MTLAETEHSAGVAGEHAALVALSVALLEGLWKMSAKSLFWMRVRASYVDLAWLAHAASKLELVACDDERSVAAQLGAPRLPADLTAGVALAGRCLDGASTLVLAESVAIFVNALGVADLEDVVVAGGADCRQWVVTSSIGWAVSAGEKIGEA